MDRIYTIGHSVHTIEKFMELLKQSGLTAVCDVRSAPYSKYTPQFNHAQIKEQPKKNGFAYVYLGKELGPRSEDPACYVEGKVQYGLLARTEIFQQGLQRLRTGMKKYRLAIMCAEKDPITCHRTILICRHLRAADIEIKHILEDGSLEDNRDLERRLMRSLKIPERTLFDRPEDLIQRAYDDQGERIAYQSKPEDADSDPA